MGSNGSALSPTGENAIPPARWALALSMVGVAGSIGVATHAFSTAGLDVAAIMLLIVAVGLCLHRAPSRRLLVAGAIGAVGLLLAVLVSTLATALSAAILAVVGLVVGPPTSSRIHNTPRGKSHSSLPDLLKSMAIASEIRDHQTSDHCDRVSRNCRLIGEYIGLTEGETTRLEWAARVHDVGKAAIPRAILQKPGPLTKREMEAVKQHCRLGADMLIAASNELSQVALAVLHHHENWDGTGYPVGLSRHKIPLESRIIAIVDVYEALTSDRPYRAAMTPYEAHQEVVSGSGTRFDPDVTTIFDELWRRGQLDTWTQPIRLGVPELVFSGDRAGNVTKRANVAARHNSCIAVS